MRHLHVNTACHAARTGLRHHNRYVAPTDLTDPNLVNPASTYEPPQPLRAPHAQPQQALPGSTESNKEKGKSGLTQQKEAEPIHKQPNLTRRMQHQPRVIGPRPQQHPTP